MRQFWQRRGYDALREKSDCLVAAPSSSRLFGSFERGRSQLVVPSHIFHAEFPDNVVRCRAFHVARRRGAAVAAPQRRTVLVPGDGAHQLTAQEVSQFPRLELTPVIFVLNNSGYLIERLLCKDPNLAYNDIAPWRYAELPHALGCEGWFTAGTTTCGELDRALEGATRAEKGAYIEVVTDAYAASPLSRKLGETLGAAKRA